MGTVKLSGSLVAGPPDVTSESFPTARFIETLSLLDGSKSYGAATGILTRNVNSSGAYLALSGLGTADTVLAPDFLYVRCSEAMLLRITTDDGSGGDVVAIVPIQGTLILEVPSGQFFKLLEVKGVGQLVYFASGIT